MNGGGGHIAGVKPEYWSIWIERDSNQVVVDGRAGHHAAHLLRVNAVHAIVDQDVIVYLVIDASVQHDTTKRRARDEIAIDLSIARVIVEIDAPTQVLSGNEACCRRAQATSVHNVVVADRIAKCRSIRVPGYVYRPNVLGLLARIKNGVVFNIVGTGLDRQIVIRVGDAKSRYVLDEIVGNCVSPGLGQLDCRAGSIEFTGVVDRIVRNHVLI